VHVAEARRQLNEAGITCRVLNLDRRAAASPECMTFRSTFDMIRLLVRHANEGWTLHFHTNGHNNRSWLLALICGLAGQAAPASLLTIHSGMAPAYLEGNRWGRLLARTVCRSYDRIIAVNEQIRNALIGMKVPAERLEKLPAYLRSTPLPLPPALRELLRGGDPILSTVLFYRPEYGFDLLVEAVTRLRAEFPRIRCIVMGSGEQQKEANRLVSANHLETALILTGDLSHELCLGMIAASDVFIRTTWKDGDSISVREALAVGVPAVASNVGTRPAGAILFEPGNVDELVSSVRKALAGRNRNKEAGPVGSRTSGGERLIDIYQRVALQEVRV